MSPDSRLINQGPNPKATFIFAHGAGAPMDSPFMDFFAEALAHQGCRVIRFEFPYMRKRRLEGKRSGPNPAKTLLASWRETVEDSRDDLPLFIGGKSMGGRYASMIADNINANGLLCLGYPFHPPGKPEKLRTAHLESLQTPCLILQGERDTFGKPEEVATYPLSEKIELGWIPDGDHSFKPRKASGLTLEQNWQNAVAQMLGFIKREISE